MKIPRIDDVSRKNLYRAIGSVWFVQFLGSRARRGPFSERKCACRLQLPEPHRRAAGYLKGRNGVEDPPCGLTRRTARRGGSPTLAPPTTTRAPVRVFGKTASGLVRATGTRCGLRPMELRVRPEACRLHACGLGGARRRGSTRLVHQANARNGSRGITYRSARLRPEVHHRGRQGRCSRQARGPDSLREVPLASKCVPPKMWAKTWVSRVNESCKPYI